MEVILLDTKFMDDTDMQGMGSSRPDYWALKDDNIKDWIKQPDVINAFTSLVLNSYLPERPKMPSCIAKDTKMLRGPVNIKDALSNVVYYTGDESTSVSIQDIKKALEVEGIESEYCCPAVPCLCAGQSNVL
jgi:hypothetical protein